jgi:hypothetical protein
MNSLGNRPISRSPLGVTGTGALFLVGALAALLAGVSLVWSGTALDRMWNLNPRAYQKLAPFGKIVGVPFLFLSVALATTAIGWFKRRLWGWSLAVIMIAAQVLGNLVNLFRGQLLEAAIGLTASGALLIYLCRPRVRALFFPPDRGSVP